MSAAGKFLKEAREAAGLRNKDVSAKLNVNTGWLSEVENGYKHPNGKLPLLCELYGIEESAVPRFHISKRPSKKVEGQPTVSLTAGKDPLQVYAGIAKVARELNDEELVDLVLLRMIDAA